MAWQGNGTGTAWEWHAVCESAFRVTFQGEINFNYVYCILKVHIILYSNGFITLMYDEKKRTFCYGKTKLLPPVILHRL